MDDIFSTLLGAIMGPMARGETVGNDTIGDYTIDTCDTVDQGWETAVRKGDGNWVIVQRYRNKESAEKGHKIWRAMCAGNPTKAYSVQLDEYVMF